ASGRRPSTTTTSFTRASTASSRARSTSCSADQWPPPAGEGGRSPVGPLHPRRRGPGCAGGLAVVIWRRDCAGSTAGSSTRCWAECGDGCRFEAARMLLRVDAEPPRISVVIPTYQRVESCRRAISSALEQELPALEVLVCDDGSTDGTQDALESWARDEPR